MVQEFEVRSSLEKHLKLDGETLDYLESYLIDQKSDFLEDEVNEIIISFLEAHGLLNNLNEGKNICNELCNELRDLGFQELDKNEGLGGLAINKPRVLDNVIVLNEVLNETESQDKKAMETLWGVDKVRKLRNDTIEVNDAGSRKYERQAAKEQKKWLDELDAQFNADAKIIEESDNQVSRMMIPDFSSNNREKDILVNKVNIFFGGSSLLEDAEIRIVYGHRYGLVGRNGVGKTTLLRHMAAFDIPGFPRHHRILHVKQEVHSDSKTVLEAVLSSDVERMELIKREKEILAIQEEKGDDAPEHLSAELTEIYERMDNIGAHTAEARATQILNGLQFTEKMRNSSTASLSGGWRMRVSLAAALFIEPDVLMLDEPTNHLDLEAVLWLQNYLITYPHTVLVVSHDRAFLDEVSTDMILFKNQKLSYYRGSYSIFLGTRKEQALQQQRLYEAQKAKREHMQEFVDRFRFNAKKASLVQSRIKAIEKMEVVAEAEKETDTFNFVFPDAGELGRPVIQVEGVSFGYEGPESLLFKNVHMGIDQDTRIALVGPNGAGKSTLMNLILEKIHPMDGRVMVNPQLRLGIFTQHHLDSFNLLLSAVENMQAKWPLAPEQELRSHLGRFEIHGKDSVKPMRFMSGGQKSRVAFACLTYAKPHVVLLDEPTNHLDLEAIEALTEAIKKFNGGVLIISHDQYFIQSVCEQIWVVGEGEIKRFRGDFEDYKNKCIKSFQKKASS